MVLASTSVKFDPEKLELAKKKGVNVSLLCRNALDICLKLEAGDMETLQSQLTEIRKQMDTLQLEEKLVLDQIQSLESEDVLQNYREAKFQKWKKNIAYMYRNKKLDWEVQKKLFKFSNMEDCQKWVIGKLQKENLISLFDF